MISFKDIMTRAVIFYDDEYRDECVAFAKLRNIHYLPHILHVNNCYQFDAEAGAFRKRKMNPAQWVDVSDDAFHNDLVNAFEKYQVLFVSQQKQYVGVIHFSDYNRKPVYQEVYNLLFLLERGLRYMITTFSGLKRSDWLAFRKAKTKPTAADKKADISSADLHAEDVSLRTLLTFAVEKGLLRVRTDHLHSIVALRNNIAHSNELISKVKKEPNQYAFRDFKLLISRINALRIAIRQVNNRIYLMKATLDDDFSQSVMPLEEFLFYHE